MGAQTSTAETVTTLALGDRVRFSGTVEKFYPKGYACGGIEYRDAPLPGFTGYCWANGNAETLNSVDTGVVIGKRRYVPMENDEGIWVPSSDKHFVGYLVAYHLSRKPVIVRLDQIAEINGEPTEEMSF